MWLWITACDSGNAAATVVAYGHLGDGNVHLNVSAPKYDDEVLIENPYLKLTHSENALLKLVECLNMIEFWLKYTARVPLDANTHLVL